MSYNTYGQEIKPENTTALRNLTIQQLTDTIKISQPDEAKIFKEILLGYNDEDLVKANELRKLGYFFYKKKEYEKSIEYINEAIKFFKAPQHDKFLYSLYVVKGNAYLLSWKYTKALDAYYKALEINQASIKNEVNEAIININIAIVYRKVRQFVQAKKVYKNTLNFIERSKIKNSKTHVKVLSEISFLYIDLEEYDSITPYLNDGIRISKLYDYKDEVANFYTANGIALYHKGEYDKAIKYLSDAENNLLNEDVPEKRYLVNNTFFIAKCFYAQQNYQKSINKIHEVIDMVDDDEYNTEAIDLYNLLAKSNKAMGNDEEAIQWYEKSIELDKRSKKEKDNTIETIYEKEKEILGEEINILEKIKSKIISVLLLLILIIAITLIVYFKKQKSNKLVFNKLIEKINTLETRKDKKPKLSNAPKEMVIDDQKVHKVLKELEKLEKQEYFLKVDCNLGSMSKKIKTNTLYLSKIIKNYKEKSFNEYINDLRINYALRRLKNDKTFRLFSIKSIALEIGYKSDHSFVKHFKAKTGLNPSYYIKNLQQIKSNS